MIIIMTNDYHNIGKMTILQQLYVDIIKTHPVLQYQVPVPFLFAENGSMDLTLNIHDHIELYECTHSPAQKMYQKANKMSL